MFRKTIACLTLIAAVVLSVGLWQRVAQACDMGDPTCGGASPGSVQNDARPCSMSDPGCGATPPNPDRGIAGPDLVHAVKPCEVGDPGCTP
ncbi:MAG TPA: hypothetical protein PKC18_09070 [Lacipirellulaceae bacterium]|nr:hypothetical protein [Lacipirellulaceae bacterium]